MKASIVLTTYNRAPLLLKTLNSFARQEYEDYEVVVVDDGNDEDTKNICSQDKWEFPIRYFKRAREPGTHYSNPAIPNNIGIKQACGEIVILQNAECIHVSPEVIKSFVDRTPPNTAVFASVLALNPTGGPEQFYCHSRVNPRPFFFCGALHRSVFMELQGFDENFKFYGYDDDQFAHRLRLAGIPLVFADEIKVHHLWHPSSFKPEDAERNLENARYYEEWLKDFSAGKAGVKVNIGKEWGKL